MKLVKFPQSDNEVLIDPEKVSHIRKETAADRQSCIVFVFFGRTDEWEKFVGKDAKRIWDYFKVWFEDVTAFIHQT